MRSLSPAYLKHISAALVVAGCAFFAPVQAQTPAPAPAAAAAPAAVAPAPAAAPAAAAKKAAPDQVENPYGLEALWNTSDIIARIVLVLLAIMSIGSWYIMVVKAMEQSKMNRQATAAFKNFWAAGTIEQGTNALAKNSAFRFIAEAGLDATTNHSGLKRHIPLADWISMNVNNAIDRVQSTSQGGLSFLATVGSTSPFVGLFGTVWGIYHALTAIGISGQASIDKVAGPVGEALIMTAIGLAVAIPAVLGYNWLVRRNKALMDDVRTFGEELNAVIVGANTNKPA